MIRICNWLQTSTLLLAVVALLAGRVALAGADSPRDPPVPVETSLTLSIGDVQARAGDLISVVFRTYASRGIGQGQICLRMAVQRSPAGLMGLGGPIQAFNGGKVYSPDPATLDRSLVSQAGPTPEFALQFQSPLGEINSLDGPLGVMYFRISDNVFPDQEYEIRPDLPDTYLVDADGVPVPLEVRPGRLRIIGPGDRFELSASAEATRPGGIALLSVQTSELRALSGGQAVLRYDPAIAAYPPAVRLDPRYGRAQFSTEGSLPEQGLMMITFTSPDASFNKITGDIIQVAVPTRDDVPVGTHSLVWLDPALTFLFDAQGSAIPLEFEADTLVFE